VSWHFSHLSLAAKTKAAKTKLFNMTVRVQTEDFDLSAEIAQLRMHTRKVGAVVTFIGTVRDLNEGEHVAEMELEHYPGMTEKALQDIIDQAKSRWDIFDALVIHRVGPLKPLDQIVLKTQAPFWKKEQTPSGARWVDARVSDDEAMAKWDPSR